jgi:hypothetical protein
VACTKPGVSHTKPTVPSATIDAPAGTTLIGGYYAEGNQIYTCVASADAGSSGDAADAAPAGTWANTAEATVYGDGCSEFATHGYTATPGSPYWKSKADGSQITATRQAAVAAPVADGGDGGATAITWVLLKATANTGEGIFANATYVQRVATTGGLGPSGACDPGDENSVRKSPYTAVYYFYTGGTSEGGTTEAGEASTTPDSGGTTEAGAD